MLNKKKGKEKSLRRKKDNRRKLLDVIEVQVLIRKNKRELKNQNLKMKKMLTFYKMLQNTTNQELYLRLRLSHHKKMRTMHLSQNYSTHIFL